MTPTLGSNLREIDVNGITEIRSMSDTLLDVLENHLLSPLSASVAHQLAPTSFISAKLNEDARQLTANVLCLVGPYKHGGCTSRSTLNSHLLAVTLRDELQKSLMRAILGDIVREPFTIANRPSRWERDAMTQAMNAATFSAMVEYHCQDDIAQVGRMMAFYGPEKGHSGFDAACVICPQLFGHCLARALAHHGWSFLTSALMLLMGTLLCRNLRQILTPLAVELGQPLLAGVMPTPTRS